ncbi:MAG: helix-hairpin-helix domain-containing protein [Candidatus Cloacimonetes bacterium]|nr:helix-hairpin-helix domain-containing protein [Candidatus Cloacimonadota bacterium]
MKKFLLMLLALGCMGFLAAKVDLNTATLQELMQLPISEEQARDIFEYREYKQIFNNIFELRDIPSIDQSTLLRLRPLVVVSLYVETDDVALRREEIRDLLERLDSNEGSAEGMADVWEDYLMTPQNVNRMQFDDLISLPNVSGVDAVAILRRTAQGDTIADTRDLRGSTGLSHYGYTNLRSYVYFKEPPVKDRLMWDAQLQYYTRYFEEGQYDMLHESFLRNDYGSTTVQVPHLKSLSYWGYYGLDKLDPDIMMKMRMRYGNNFKLGIMNYTAKGEPGLLTTNTEDFLKDSKFYAGYENSVMPGLNNSRLKVYLGNYRVTYGEGLVMENTDYYSARKTGFGFSKRILGITPDLSRTQEYSLKGGAVEYTTPMFGVSAFASQDEKDAIVYVNRDGTPVKRDDFGNDVFTNKDSSSEYFGRQYYINEDGDTVYNYENGNQVSADKIKVLNYTNPTLRYDTDSLMEAEAWFNSELDKGTPYATDYINLATRTDALNEKLLGTHLQVNPFIGTKLGFTTYTSYYDNAHFIVPGNDDLLKTLLRDSYYYTKLSKALNAEITSLYSTQNDSYSRDYRRIIGFDGQTVIGNTSVQGEYAELSVTGGDTKIGDDPKAYLVSSYTQFENLYFITILRNYDVGFDNPYSNSFSEHERFEDSILEKNIYALTNPTTADLYLNSNQSQPERGVYFETRYKFNNFFTVGRSYLDLWERLTDGRRTSRFQSELEFRPLFQVSLRLRYKNQVNRYDDDAERGVSKTNEYTMAARTFLSARDFLELEYRYNTVQSPPYTSLTNPAEIGENTMAAAMTLMTGDYIAANYTHNFNSSLKLQGSFLYWFGHGISHWDWEDMEIDFMGERGSKAWIAITSRISQNLYMNIKFKNKTYQDKELRVRLYNDPDYTDPNYPNVTLVDDPVYFQRVEHSENTIRFSLDYRF